MKKLLTKFMESGSFRFTFVGRLNNTTITEMFGVRYFYMAHLNCCGCQCGETELENLDRIHKAGILFSMKTKNRYAKIC